MVKEMFSDTHTTLVMVLEVTYFSTLTRTGSYIRTVKMVIITCIRKVKFIAKIYSTYHILILNRQIKSETSSDTWGKRQLGFLILSQFVRIYAIFNRIDPKFICRSGMHLVWSIQMIAIHLCIRLSMWILCWKKMISSLYVTCIIANYKLISLQELLFAHHRVQKKLQ